MHFPFYYGRLTASQLTGAHNKTGIADHIAMKFAANIPHIIRSLCSKFGDNSFIFKEVTTKRSMDPSSQFADPSLTAVSP